ncbi:MAG: SRPBCC family protein [Desulfuromonadales bacterium]|nr:SRPBCC family protein [Desulfuromonadales bacterium]
MKSQTISVFITVPATHVYAFAANPAHLPLWVPSFFKSVESIDGEWVAQSPEGRVVVAFVSPNDFGVLDHTVTLSSGQKLTNYMRVIPNEEGSEILFTFFQREGMTDQQFQEDAALVLGDFQTLRRVLENAAR